MDNKISIMIGVPTTEYVMARFAQSLASACAFLAANKIGVEILFKTGAYIDQNRQDLVYQFLDSEHTHLWWIDNDMEFPVDAGMRLLSHDQLIVGCNYRRRSSASPVWTAMRNISYIDFSKKNLSTFYPSIDRNRILSVWHKDDHDSIDEITISTSRCYRTHDDSPPLDTVDVLPNGMMLVKKSLYQTISDPHHLCYRELDEKGKIIAAMGEDVWFCKKVREAGIDIWVDNNLSKDISHIGVFPFSYNLPDMSKD